MFVALSCSSIDSDAKKAASFTNKSIEKTHQLKLDEAEKFYKKSQEIINKYQSDKSQKKSEKFFKLYQQYRDEGKTIAGEQKRQ